VNAKYGSEWGGWHTIDTPGASHRVGLMEVY
jgi:hypothetical protein